MVTRAPIKKFSRTFWTCRIWWISPKLHLQHVGTCRAQKNRGFFGPFCQWFFEADHLFVWCGTTTDFVQNHLACDAWWTNWSKWYSNTVSSIQEHFDRSPIKTMGVSEHWSSISKNKKKTKSPNIEDASPKWLCLLMANNPGKFGIWPSISANSETIKNVKGILNCGWKGFWTRSQKRDKTTLFFYIIDKYISQIWYLHWDLLM